MHEKTKFDYIDIHSHLNLSPLFENQDEMMVRLRENNTAAITVGVDM